MLLDCWEDMLGFPALVKKVKIEREYTYGDSKEPMLKPIVSGPARPRHQGRKPDEILIEDKGSGISLRQQLAAEQILTQLYMPDTDKLSRLHAVSPMFAHRRVWAVESDSIAGQPRAWAEPLIIQVCSYVGPGSIEHDDLLDTSTQALKKIMDGWRMTFTVPRDPDLEKREQLEREKRKALKTNPYG
jgi:predicted phage terminase large subunit-like protein